MNVLTKRVPRDPDLAQINAGIETLREFGIDDSPTVLRQIVVSVYYGMTSKAPVDPVEKKLEEIYEQRSAA